MDFIRKKIDLNEVRNRKDNPTYSEIDGTHFYFKVGLYNNIDDIGYYDSIDGVVGTTVNDENEVNSDIRVSGKPLVDYFVRGGIVSGFTDSKKDNFITYKIDEPFIVNFDVDRGTYVNPFDENIIGVSRVIELVDENNLSYVIDTSLNNIISETNLNGEGIFYEDNENNRSVVFNMIDSTFNEVVPLSKFIFNSQGFNQRNVELRPIIKSEYSLGITETPKIENDIFIDRGEVSVFDKHMKLGSISSMQQLELFGNGEFKIIN